MGTTDVRLDPKLNIAIWKRGVQGVENRMRLRISRKEMMKKMLKKNYLLTLNQLLSHLLKVYKPLLLKMMNR